ncbi:MAG: site-specific integrase [Clostridia bacterium]|nr:site-specific integrase [Clostridia bacterium]
MERRDNKGRLLRRGEGQRKDGRYFYKYIDRWGKTKYAYSWRLTETDRLPPGKANCKSLRELETEVQRDLILKENLTKSDVTLGEYLEAYMANKKNLRENIEYNYRSLMKTLKLYAINKMKLQDIIVSHAKQLMIDLSESGQKYSSIAKYKSFLYTAFDTAYEDGIIARNPFGFKLCRVIANNTEKRTALTERERDRLFKYIKEHYPDIYLPLYIMAYAGLRVSEMCGLTYRDIDFEKGLIRIDRQLKWGYISKRLIIDPPKTEAGYRCVPMDDEMREMLKEVVKEAKSRKHQPVVDGVSGFLFINRKGTPHQKSTIKERMKTVIRNYEKEAGAMRIKVTPHILRHTFCYIACKNGVEITKLQYIMGHTSPQITLGVYASIDVDESIVEEFLNE